MCSVQYLIIMPTTHDIMAMKNLFCFPGILARMPGIFSLQKFLCQARAKKGLKLSHEISIRVGVFFEMLGVLQN